MVHGNEALQIHDEQHCLALGPVTGGLLSMGLRGALQELVGKDDQAVGDAGGECSGVHGKKEMKMLLSGVKELRDLLEPPTWRTPSETLADWKSCNAEV